MSKYYVLLIYKSALIAVSSDSLQQEKHMDLMTLSFWSNNQYGTQQTFINLCFLLCNSLINFLSTFQVTTLQTYYCVILKKTRQQWRILLFWKWEWHTVTMQQHRASWHNICYNKDLTEDEKKMSLKVQRKQTKFFGETHER